MCTFTQKFWKASATAAVLKERKIRLLEDLTYRERQRRNKLWPLDDKPRKEGKKTTWRGHDAIIDGKKITAQPVKDKI